MTTATIPTGLRSLPMMIRNGIRWRHDGEVIAVLQRLLSIWTTDDKKRSEELAPYRNAIQIAISDLRK